MRLLAQLPIQERSQAAEARRKAVQLAVAAGFSQQDAGRVAIVAMEAANNLLNHAVVGEILISAAGNGVEILSIDRGPGMDLETSLRDGYSTAGTPGTGLGAMRRLSDWFDAFSDGAGTVIATGFGPRPTRVGVAAAPVKGEAACGDAWSVVERNEATWILVADGLGHGELAAEASNMAVEIFETSRLDTATSVVEDIHAGLRASRGAAIAVAAICGSTVSYCGLGNVAGVLLADSKATHMVSMNGTAGAEARKIREFCYTRTPAALLVMHSDGLQSQWSLDRYPGILRRDPAVIAGVLYRDFRRVRDDVTVLVLRQ